MPEYNKQINAYIYGSESVWVNLIVLIIFATTCIASFKTITNKDFKQDEHKVYRYLSTIVLMFGSLYMGIVLIMNILI